MAILRSSHRDDFVQISFSRVCRHRRRGRSLASAAHADSGTIRFAIYKAAFFVGGAGGEGTLTFHGRRYPISVGGISGGLAFGASKTYFQGSVGHIRRARDVTGIYGRRAVAGHLEQGPK